MSVRVRVQRVLDLLYTLLSHLIGTGDHTMSFADDARALIEKVTGIKTKAASLAALTSGYRQKYRDILAQATSLEQARAALGDLEASLVEVDGDVAEAVAANTDANDNGIPDRDEVPAAPTTPDEPVAPII